MAKISELGPILGINTRTEDLFVIVNLIQGDDGTKNITRKELVEAIQYEVFSRIEITGGTIRNVVMSNSVLNNVTINDSVYNRGTINDTVLNNITIRTADANNVTQTFSTISQSTMTESSLSNVAITTSSFDDGTANNVAITFSSFDDGTMERGTGNNMVFTNSVIDNATITNSSANNFAITNGTADNIQITNSDFSDGTGNNNIFDNTTLNDPIINDAIIEGAVANNLVITNLNLDEVVMTDVTIARGSIDDMDIANSTFTGILDTVYMANSVIETTVFRDGTISNTAIDTSTFTSGVISSSVINNSSANNLSIDNSSFDNGTADNLVTTNSTQTNAAISDSSFNNGTADNVEITNSEFKDGTIKAVELSNVEIIDSNFVDFDINLSNTFDQAIDENSYFVLKNVKTGQTEQMTYKQLNDEIGRTTEKALKVHVAVDGDDDNPGSILKPVRTLARASQLAIEKAGGDPNRNALNEAVHISVGPGTYYVDEPIVLPDDCSLTSTAGQYATVIQKKPGWERTNGVLVGSGCYVQGFSYMNFEVDNFDQPEGGFAIAYRPGALMRRSPYIRDSTQLSNFNRLDVEPPLNPFNSKGTILDLGQEFYLEAGHSNQTFFEVDDEVTFSSGASGYISYIDDINANSQIYVRNLKGNVEPGDILYAQSGGTGTVERLGIDDFPNRLVGRGGGCVLCDRALLDTDSLYTYLLCFGFTPRTQNGTGYCAKNGAGINGIGSLSIFTRQAFFALDGGQVTLNNSGSQFGDISMRARGKTTIVKPAEGFGGDPALFIANSAFADALEEAETEIVQDMVDYLTANTTTGYNGGPGLGYQGYNADKCFRDTGIIVDNTGYDIATKGNYWGRLNGITYRSPISYVVVNEQLTETKGSIEHIKDEVDFIFSSANSEIIERANNSLQETLNILENGEAAANPIIFADTGVGSQTGARETLQDNREFVIEEFIDWLDNNPNFFAYDSDKCKRDVREYILPAVKYDTLLDTNYNSVTAGQAYYFNAARAVIGEQRDETIGAYERLRLSTDSLVQANSAAFAAEAYEKFNEIIQILKREGDKYTPKGATYNPTTGEFVIDFKAAHTLQVGKYVWLMPEAFTFTCDTNNNTTEIVHPRKSDPTYNRALPILEATATTITLNVGSTGYSGVHTFVDALDNSVVELGSTITFSDDAGISADKKNARIALQANKEYIQDYMMAWADNEWFFYDSEKCQRDMKQHIVPAVLRDTLTGTNFNSIQSGIAYRQAISSVTVDDQLTQTIGAIDYLKTQSANTVSDSIAVDRVNAGFDEVITIAQNSSKTYTPTDADYNYETGEMEITIGAHDFQVGDSIKIAPNSMIFSCPSDAQGNPAVQIAHPRTTDPFYNKPIVIFETTNTTIKVQVGEAKVVKIHTFVSASPNCIVDAGIYDGKFTPRTATYDPVTGDMTIDIGAHTLPVGKWISFADESITFSCVNTATLDTVEITHPRPTEPAFRQPVRITDTTSDSITVNVGNAGGYSGVHTFVSADQDCIDSNAIYWTDAAKIDSFHTPSNATYDPATGDMVLTINDHGFTTDDHIEFKPQSIVFSCANTVTSVVTEISHPRIGEPNYQRPFEISSVTTNTITVNAGTIPNGYTGAHTFVSAEEGSVIKLSSGATLEGYKAAEILQQNKAFLQAEVDAWLKDNYFVYNEEKCRRDTGYILDAVARDMATGSNVNAVFAGLSYRTGNASANTVINEQLTETVGAITWLKGQISNIIGGVGQTRAEAAFDEIIDIMQNDVAAADTLNFGTAYVSEDRFKVQERLQANKAFIIDEATNWIDDYAPGLVYNQADCERDLGYFIDAISWDIQHNSTASSIGNARIYFDNAISVLAEAEKPVTAEVYDFVANIAGQIAREENVTPLGAVNQVKNASSDAVTPTDATYDPLTGVMVVTAAGHGLEAGNYIVIENGGITFECGSPVTQISHPRATDPYFNTPIEITEATTNTFTVYVGDAQGYDGVHVFVSASPNCIKRSIDPTVALDTVETFKIVADIIRNDDYSEIPTIQEPTLTGTGYNDEINGFFNKITGRKPKYQQEIIDYIRETYNGLGYEIEKCPRDVGYIVDAISEDIEYGGDAATANAAQYYFEGAINVLPYYQREPTRLAWEHLADVIEDVVQETSVTVTSGNSETQVITGLPASGATGTEAKRLTNIISAVVDDYLVVPDYSGSLDISVGQQTPRALPQANTALAPALEPSRTYARKSLQKNRKFIQDEVVAYINDTFFTYNADKCARDVTYILNAVKRDVLTNGNYYGVYTGLAYRTGTVGANKVLDEQLAETIAAIEWLKEDVLSQNFTVAGTLEAATASFNNIIEIMKYGESAKPAGWPTYTTEKSTSHVNAGEAILANKTFLQEEAIAWMTANYPSITYDQAKCRRDTGILVDALIADVRHDSTSAVQDFVRLYFENGINVGLPLDQREPTAELYERIGDVCQQLALKQIVTKSPANPENQVTTGFNSAAASEATIFPTLTEIISDTIIDDSIINLPDVVEPTDAGSTAVYAWDEDAAKISARIAPLSASINDFLQNKFDYLDYDSVKCARDTGYMVDAISHDIQYGGNSAMWNAANIYFVNATNLLPFEQRAATRKAFTHMAQIMHDVIRNEDITKTTGNSNTQDTSNLAARRDIAAEAKSLALMVANIADDNDPSNLPARVEPFTDWVSKTLITEKDKIDDAMDSLVTSMINYISSEYNGISYPKEKCRRDVAILVDALSHDVNYTTNYAMRLAANMYFDNAISVLPFDQREQTADFYEEMGNLVSNIVQNISTQGTAYTPTNAVYDHITGMLSLTIGSHDLEIGDHIYIDEESLGFTYGGGTNISYPNANTPGFDTALPVVVADSTTVGVYMGVSDGTVDQPHTFASSVTDCVKEVLKTEASQVTQFITPATATEGEEVNDLVRIVQEAIRRNSLDALPELVEPDTSWVEAEKLLAAELIDDNLDYLADDVTQFIADNYEIIDYSKAKCRRDSGYIIDAMSWDLNYGGNLASRWNADFYYWNNELRIPENTRVATAEAYRQLGKIVSDVVVGNYPGQKIRPEMGAETQQQQAIDLGNIYFNALFYNTPKALGPTIEPDFEWEEDKTFNFAKEILENNKSKIQREVQRFITSTYKFIDLPKTYRDGGNLINILANDFRYVNAATNDEGTDKSTRSFAAALFNIDSQHVFPVFNCPPAFTDWRRLRFKGTVDNTAGLPDGSADEPRKRWDAYIVSEQSGLLNPDGNNYKGEIYYFNGTAWITTGQQNNVDLLESFYKAWKNMKDYINNNISPNGATQIQITELIENVLIDTVLRPDFLAFGSLVESIAHQFNGASAGVNRNALPLNFRNIGAAIGATASVLSEDGGRIRWSGSDELNNQYFARGLRINGRTGRIEGRPFTSSVRKLARRASNSRAVL